VLSPIIAELISRLETNIRDSMATRSLLAGLVASHADRSIGPDGCRSIAPQIDVAMRLAWAHSIGDLTVASAPWVAARQTLKADPFAGLDGLLALPAGPPRPPAA
jgi:hypothetical protein